MGEGDSRVLLDYFRYEAELPAPEPVAALGGDPGYFLVDGAGVGYGRVAGASPAADPGAATPCPGAASWSANGTLRLPFDLNQVIDALRLERYVGTRRIGGAKGLARKCVRSAYYFVRPLLPVPVRRHLQRRALRDWQSLRFPRWPVDTTVDSLMRLVLGAMMRSSGVDRVPFVWFWPDGHQSCLMVTHDVETAKGRDFCPELTRIDASYGFKSSFQVVPEKRYTVPPAFLDAIRSAECEVCVHGLNHDGHLFSTREEYLRRIVQINRYARDFGAKGFRSPVLYRNLEWLDAFEFEYDMSVPNVAHLDPQRGGCCTVMPYFIGHVLELPVTATQDYSQFHILRSGNIDLWKQQSDLITRANGLLSFIVHPDYILPDRFRRIYEELLAHLRTLCEERNVWVALPGEINRWWRQRAAMRVVDEGGRLRIHGDGAERARVAHAILSGDQIVYEIADE